MGREAYLTRMALGRSAYEPPEQLPAARAPAQSPAHPEPSASDHDGENRAAVRITSEPDPQLFNERGRPMNPRSRAYARAMRVAQNDVLASVGVCVRNAPSSGRGSFSDAAKDQRVVDLVASETMYGSVIGIGGILAKYAGVWWTTSLRDRLLAFDVPMNVSFAQLVVDEYRRAGPFAFFFAGFPAHLISLVVNDGTIWSSVITDLIDDFAIASVSSRRVRKLWQKSRHVFRWTLCVTIEVLFAPLLVQSNLQKLHLIPATQILPHWRAFLPLSSAFLVPTLVHPPKPWTFRGFAFWATSVATSPLVMLQAWRQMMNYFQGYLYPLFAASILIPDHPDRYSIDIERREEMKPREGRPLTVVHTAISFVGWGHVANAFTWPGFFSFGHRHRISDRSAAPQGSLSQAEPLDTSAEPQSPRARGLEQAHPREQNDRATQTDRRSTTPAGDPSTNAETVSSPTSSTVPDEYPRNPDDPTIRISYSSTAAGTVNLEIALPDDPGAPRSNPAQRSRGDITPTPHDADAGPSTRADRETHPQPQPHPHEPPPPFSPHQPADDEPHHPQPRHAIEPRRSSITHATVVHHHRVTALAEEPADMLATLLNGFISGWALIPLKALILRRIAAVVATTAPWMLASAATAPAWPLHKPLAGPWTHRWFGAVGGRGAVALTGKVALCCVIEAAVSLGLWGVQWGAIRWLGVRYYEWGRL